MSAINPRTKIVDTDILVVGGGMSGSGATWEAKFWCRGKCKVTVVEKSTLERGGAVAMGLSAINMYMGMRCRENTPEDFVRYVRNEFFGILREDLVYDIARHVDSTVHLFERWGLPIWVDEKTGCYQREGRWQVMIHGESYKPIVGEAARKAADEVYERVMLTHLLLDERVPNRVAGAVGFGVRDGTFYVFRAKAVILTTGGATLIYRPRATGEGLGRVWYAPWASGSGYAMAIMAGAETTSLESRLVVVRFKDGYGPVGAWYLLIKTRSTDLYGEQREPLPQDMMERYKSLYGKYAEAKPTPTTLRVLAVIEDLMKGRAPHLMQTQERLTTQEAINEGFEDFLDMTISQVNVWAGQNIHPQQRPSELMPTEPYIMGSHASPAGMWASGPADIAPPEYRWGPNRMLTVEGLFCAGDICGASGHKFSSGSFTEGRIAGKSAARYVLTQARDYRPTISSDTIERYKEVVFRPMEWYEANKGVTTHSAARVDPWFDINPNYINWFQFMTRLQKIMDEYVAGWSTYYQTNEPLLNRALELLQFLREDFRFVGAANLHELLRVWEFYHRMVVAEAVTRSILARKETRFPGYTIRADYPALDDEKWHVFVNLRYDPRTGNWDVYYRPVIHIID